MIHELPAKVWSKCRQWVTAPVRWVKGKLFPDGPAPPLLEWIHRNKLPPENGAAVILIHGFIGDAVSTWPDFGRLLAAEHRLQGWDVASLRYQTKLLPDLSGVWRSDAPIERLARMLRTACSIGELQNYGAFSFVAHSMGGLVLQRALVDDAKLVARTRHIFLFGTPSNGLAKAAAVGILKRTLGDMADDSPFIKDLRGRWREHFGTGAPFEVFAVAGENDEFVPEGSSLGPFPDDQCKVIPGDHVQIVKAKDAADAGVQLVIRGITGDAAAAGPLNAARVAVEKGKFHETIARFGEPGRWSSLDPVAKVSLALALESVGRGERGLELLDTAERKTSDLIGTLAGRLKRRWLMDRQQNDATRAAELYRTGYNKATETNETTNHEQAFYHAINCAFMSLVAEENRAVAAEWARKALEHAESAPDDRWKFATQGEAHLILGDSGRSEEHYTKALQEEPAPREVASMYQQARRIVEAAGRQDRKGAEALEKLFNPSEWIVSG